MGRTNVTARGVDRVVLFVDGEGLKPQRALWACSPQAMGWTSVAARAMTRIRFRSVDAATQRLNQRHNHVAALFAATLRVQRCLSAAGDGLNQRHSASSQLIIGLKGCFAPCVRLASLYRSSVSASGSSPGIQNPGLAISHEDPRGVGGSPRPPKHKITSEPAPQTY